jgi:hypothetical protein
MEYGLDTPTFSVNEDTIVRDVLRTALIAEIDGVVSLLVERLWHRSHARRRKADAPKLGLLPDDGAGDGDVAAD